MKILLAVLIFGGALLSMAHFWINDHLAVLRFIYPIEAALAKPTLACSDQAPIWMKETLKFSLWENSSPAGQLAYVSPDGEVFECHYGWVGTPAMSALVNENTRFRYASMTKLLTADMVLKEAVKGSLNLDDKLLDFFPEVPQVADEQLRQVTVAQLMNHSAGFDRMLSVDSMVERNKKPWCPYDLTPLAKIKLDFLPGSRFAYSNINYCLLGSVLERSTGEEFRALLDREYQLSLREIKFIDSEYLPDEVAYDFRNSDFYDETYPRYFDFYALSSSMGLSGSASAFASLLTDIGYGKYFPVAKNPACDTSKLRGCYVYSALSYKQPGSELLIYIQPGFLYSSPSVAIIDDRGGITVWVGNGTRLAGSSTDFMIKFLYQKLDAHYTSEAQ